MYLAQSINLVHEKDYSPLPVDGAPLGTDDEPVVGVGLAVTLVVGVVAVVGDGVAVCAKAIVAAETADIANTPVAIAAFFNIFSPPFINKTFFSYLSSI